MPRCTPYPANQTLSLQIDPRAVLPARTRSVSYPGIREAEVRAVHCPCERSAAVDLKIASQPSLTALVQVLDQIISGQDSRDRAETHPLSGMR